MPLPSKPNFLAASLFLAALFSAGVSSAGCGTAGSKEVAAQQPTTSSTTARTAKTAKAAESPAKVTGREVSTDPPAERDPTWATPISRPGLPNLHRVSDRLYRGAQPAEEGFAELKQMGVRTVVNLRSFHSDRDDTEANGLGYEHIFVKAWHPEDEEVVRFLRIVSDDAKAPILVHCKHGADRTGIMSAIYRIAIDGWTKDKAIEEMTRGGFGFHSVWSNLVDYVRELDIGRLKREAGGPEPPSEPSSE